MHLSHLCQESHEQPWLQIPLLMLSMSYLGACQAHLVTTLMHTNVTARLVLHTHWKGQACLVSDPSFKAIDLHKTCYSAAT